MMTREEALLLCEIQYHDLPGCSNGFVTEIKPRKHYIIVLNKKTRERNSYTLEHELAHIRLDHFHDLDKPMQVCEQEAHEMALSELAKRKGCI